MKNTSILQKLTWFICALALVCAFAFNGCACAEEELSDQQKLAVNLVQEYGPGGKGRKENVTRVEDLYVDDFYGSPCHVLMVRTSSNFVIVYSYLSGEVYPFSDQKYGEFAWSEQAVATEEGRCCLLANMSHSTNRVYVKESEIRSQLTKAEVKQVNQAVKRGETYALAEIVPPPVEVPVRAETSKEVVMEAPKAEAEKLAVAPPMEKEEEEKPQPIDLQLVARLVEENFTGSNPEVVFAEEYSIDDLEGWPVHALLVRMKNEVTIAYSYGSAQAYSFTAREARNATQILTVDRPQVLSTLEARLRYLAGQSLTTRRNGGIYENDRERHKILTAEELNEVNQALGAEKDYVSIQDLASEIEAVPEESYRLNYSLVSRLPQLFTERRLSDKEIAALHGAKPETLRKKISTPADFAAWVDAEEVTYCCKVHNGDGSFTYGVNYAFEWYQQNFDAACAASLAMYMLKDDLPSMGMLIVPMNYDEVVMAGNVFPADGGYYVFSLDTMSKMYEQDKESIIPEGFPLVFVDELEKIVSYCESNNNFSAPGGVVMQVFYKETQEEVTFDYVDLVLTPREAQNVREIYRSERCDLPKLPATIPQYTSIPEGRTYRLISNLPKWVTERRLSDEEILALKNADLSVLTKRVSTPADFAAWLDASDADYCTDVMSNNYRQQNFEPQHIMPWQDKVMSASMAAPLAMRMLSDDIPGMGVVVASMEYFADNAIIVGNYIPADGGYYIFSFDALTLKRQMLNDSGVFPLIWVEELSDLMAYCGSKDDISCADGRLVQLFSFDAPQGVVMDLRGGYYWPQDPELLTEIYRSDEPSATVNFSMPITTKKSKKAYEADYIRPELISKFKLSQLLGGVTLTAEEACELLEKPPEEVKERVKTAADVLMLMLAGKYGDVCGDVTVTVKGVNWHYNISAFEVMERRLTNCGSAANLANYLLEGDYDEVGFIQHAYLIGDIGSHIYNYFLYEGKYYIVDFSSYMFNFYLPQKEYPVTVVNKLEDYAGRVPPVYGALSVLFAETSAGRHSPVVFDDRNKAYAVPEGAKYTVLKQWKGDKCYELKEYPLESKWLEHMTDQ